MNGIETKTTPSRHTLCLDNRSQLSLKGITDIVCFDDVTVILQIHDTTLTIEGTGLHISQLSIENGIVEIEGRVDGIFYSDGRVKQKAGLFRRWGK